VAGEVAAIGLAVTQFTVGDRLFGVNGYGAHTEFVCTRQDAALAQMPAGLSF
jgi:NADPH:quinone reductase-like Zn-dependent oxidoreductase